MSSLASALSAADELATCRETEAMLRLAIDLARERIGLERVGLFMRDSSSCDHVVMRGTWGTGARGETTDERALHHVFAPREYNALLASRLSGSLGMYRPRAPLFAAEPGRTVVIGEGWVMATPLVAGRDMVGVMYTDAALSRAPMDESKQAAVAVFCSLLAVVYQGRRPISGQPLPRRQGQSTLVERVLSTLNGEGPVTGERLASELGVSAGHLARSFKREMGVSLVDYRNRLRLDRFYQVIQRRGRSANLLDAALEAGFGSYAQFHRIYRRHVGTTPSQVFTQAQLPADAAHGEELPPEPEA
jgi:AraC-like DNA-binding protein